ncbi:histidine kinase hhk13p [Phlyctema vagabunda]|uniref:histidine kinase n=1 Tax=Phlyctema vagabunda TaxID=108571 RepID=A0ABR4PS20_9HELO
MSVQTATRKPWRAPDLDLNGNPQYTDTYILLNLYADLDEFGGIQSVMSCITDISELKWKESLLRTRMNEAITMQQQQEKFIDMTSHEMRNPLSALIGCADEIITSLNDYWSLISPGQISDQGETGLGITTNLPPSIAPPKLLCDALEAAETIIYCAMHQKRIIDDILTLSRLDSDLLVTCPEPSEPVQLIRTSLKMFEAELKIANTTLILTESKSLELLDVKWTLLDPSRVLQVFINLMTNAIKFTRTQTHRRIEVSIRASSVSPTEEPHEVEYVPRSKANKDQTASSEWGDGEILYLTITVKDTGRGLKVEERETLFRLFQQASPKTHVQYGGSGLGLFISRQLTEMQGGQIGVASEAGKGSTFEFYIKTRKTSPPIERSPKTDFQLLVRQDALREACGVEIPALQNGLLMPNVQVQAVTNGAVAQCPEPDAGLHILVVEDNLVNQKVVTKQLRNAGHQVSVANHGQEALDFLMQTEYWAARPHGERLSVILMDLEMPVMDGISCVKRIRELQHTGEISGHVPVLAVTANARKDQILSTLEAGMDDVTTKPYRMQDMLRQIEALVSRFRVDAGAARI